MSGHLSLKSLKSTIKSEQDTLAAERWNVEKERQRLDNELAEFHKQQLERCKLIRVKSNAKAVDEYEKLLFKIRWAHPPLPVRHRNVLVEYCEHLLGPHSNETFEHMHVLNMCREIAVGTQLEKASFEIDALCNKIQAIAEKRDKTIIAKKSMLISTTEKTIVKNQGKIRWMMENNVGRKDRYWTIWFLTNRCMLAELQRLVTSTTNPCDINERDPDFGLTALHYACKGRNFDIYKFLVDSGANIFLKTSDGRTCLHLAAQYSTKEIVGHLLTLGAFYDAKDNYGCMAIDLADQNKNRETFLVLDHWNKLIPPVPPSTPPPEIDLSAIPDEYLATPKHIFDAMSLRLQMLTKRIDGEGVHSFDSKLEPSIEMRLCEKHALICLQEGFLIEGIKSLRRRWRVAKNLLASENSQVLPVLSAGQVSVAGSTPAAKVNAIEAEARPAEVGLEHSAAPGSSAADASAVQPGEHAAGSGVVDASPLVMTGNSAADIGRDLVEVLLRHKFEGFALTVLCECVQLEGVDKYTMLCLHVRIAEIVLFLYDYLNKRKAKETTRSTYAPPSQKALSSTVISNAGGKSITSFIASQVIKPSEMSVAPELSPLSQVDTEQSPAATSISQSPLVINTSGNPTAQPTDTTSILDSAIVHTRKHSLGPDNGKFSPAGRDIQDKKRIDIHGPFSTMSGEFQSPGLSANNSLGNGQVAAVLDAEQAQRLMKEKLKELLTLGHISASAALQLHYDIHTEGFSGQDAITLCPLLELSSEMYEREGQWASSLQLLEYAEVVSSRALGPCHEETIRIMLVGVKLHLKCANVDAYKTACVKATDMSRRLDQLSLENPVLGDQLGRKCAEVLALSRLLEDFKEDGLDATEDDSIVLPTSLLSEKNARSSTAKQFIKEIKQVSKMHASGRSEFATDIREDYERGLRQEAKRLARLKKSLESKSGASVSSATNAKSGGGSSVMASVETKPSVVADKPLSGDALLASANRILTHEHDWALDQENGHDGPRDAMSKINAQRKKAERSARLELLATTRTEEAAAVAAANPINSDIVTYKLRPFASLEQLSANAPRIPPPTRKLEEVGRIPDAVYELIFGRGKRAHVTTSVKPSKYTLASRFFSPTSAAAKEEEVNTTVDYRTLESHMEMSSSAQKQLLGQDHAHAVDTVDDADGYANENIVDEQPIKWYL